MPTHRRINVASGRSLEKLAHYSRALRAGAMVLQSGTTAIDRQGNVHGEGDIVQQTVDSAQVNRQYSDAGNTMTLAKSIFAAVPVTMAFFLPFLLAGKLGLSFWQAYGLACLTL